MEINKSRTKATINNFFTISTNRGPAKTKQNNGNKKKKPLKNKANPYHWHLNQRELI